MLGKADQVSQLLAKDRVLALDPATRILIRQHLESLLKHSSFRGTKRCQDLLRFVVEQSLDGHLDHLKERTIGAAVFGRLPDYDTANDSVVRVAANEVRKRLAQCYMDGGMEGGIRIDLPPGFYIPEFEIDPEKIAGPKSVDPIPEMTISTVAPMAVDFSPVEKKSVWPQFIYPVAVIVLLGVCGWLLFQNQALRSGVAQESGTPKALPWSAILDSSHRTYVVLADLAVGTSEDLLQRPLHLQDYIEHRYMVNPATTNHEAIAVAQQLSTRQLTSVADAMIAAKIVRMDSRPGPRVIVQFARNMRMDDFKDNNVVLLGTSRANLWGELFTSKLNFEIVYDEKLGHHVCRNRSPQPGEQAVYMPAGPTGTTGDAYAVVALLPNLGQNGNVLIIAGSNMEATKEAGEFITNPDRYADKLKSMGINPLGATRHFEVLLRVKAVGGSSHQSDILGYRLLSTSR